jgi:hypothetical protein
MPQTIEAMRNWTVPRPGCGVFENVLIFPSDAP